MRIINKYLVLSLAILTSAVFTACVDHQARFETPTWLGGSNIEFLEDNEEYSIFLEMLKRSGFYESVNTISYTLFVPDNTAFEKYFQANGIAGVDAMTDTEVYQLFSLHILVNPRSRNDLIYEAAFGQIEDENWEYASLFFKKQTASLEPYYKELPRYHATFTDSVSIYSSAKYVPVWSKDYLEDIFSPVDGSDYEFLYPNSDFDAESELAEYALNISNAKVLPNPENPLEIGRKTSSGFIYPLDQVIEPLPTIEVYMKDNQDKYGLFYDLLQRYANYGNKTDIEVEVNGAIQVVPHYKKSYTNSIPSIADERGPRNSGWAEFYMKDYFSAFIPTDDVLQNYLDTKLLPVFGDIDSIPELTLSYLLRAHLLNSLGLVSKMEKGIFDNFGTPITISRDEINSGYMCSNGAFYEMNKVLAPYAFTSITEDLFFNTDYSTFLFMLVDNNLLTDLTTKGDEVTFFASTNDELLQANIRYEPSDESIYYLGVDGAWKLMKSDDLLEFIKNHFTYEKIPDLSGEGYIRMNSGNYAYYNNGKIQGPLNQFKNESGQTTLLKETEDGVMFHSNVPINSRNYTLAKLLHNDLTEEYAETLTDTTLSEFSDFLIASRLLGSYKYRDLITKEYEPTLSFLNFFEEWTIFAPTNEAMREARAQGLIPSRRDSMQAFVYYHCVPNRVIFDDGETGGTGTFDTYLEDETIGDVTFFKQLEINNAKNNLQVTDETGQVVNVEHSNANMLAKKGVVHKINRVLKAW